MTLPRCEDCRRPAMIFSPGTVELREVGILVTHAIPPRAACLAHALARGWLRSVVDAPKPRKPRSPPPAPRKAVVGANDHRRHG